MMEMDDGSEHVNVFPDAMSDHQKWLRNQDEETRSRYCEHEQYVGFEHRLAYRCPGCAEAGGLT